MVGDRLYFYVSGRAGKLYPGSPSEDSGGTTGLAFLRRDGFASMNADSQAGTLTTRPVTFKGLHLFVNTNCADGSLRVELLDESGSPISPFTLTNSIPVSADKTLIQIAWKDTADLSRLVGQTVRFRFVLKNGELYSFWVSPNKSGASYGYIAAGGPGYASNRDSTGEAAYRAAQTISEDKAKSQD